MNIEQFLDCLFDPEDHTCYSETPRGIALYEYPHGYQMGHCAFFSINPMDPDKTRADSAVTKYRNFLVEMDSLPLDKQEQHITEIALPYSTATYSGGKSLHFIISLETPVKDASAYRSLVKRIFKAVGDEFVDQSVRNPSRFSRLPGHIRLDTGKEQKLLSIEGRVPNAELEAWLLKRGAPPKEAWENLTPEPRSTFKNPSRLYGATKNFLMYGVESNWNMCLFKAAADMCRCGYNEAEATQELRRITGTLDLNDIKTIGSAFKNELSKTNNN
jgi:hypothetical protein